MCSLTTTTHQCQCHVNIYTGTSTKTHRTWLPPRSHSRVTNTGPPNTHHIVIKGTPKHPQWQKYNKNVCLSIRQSFIGAGAGSGHEKAISGCQGFVIRLHLSLWITCLRAFTERRQWSLVVCSVCGQVLGYTSIHGSD